ncbi:COX15/CtaA family protein [Candidatus Pelagibacter sp.]|nr:COX15/CtaA family protein [Candidatus Pelagibacter sp.]
MYIENYLLKKSISLWLVFMFFLVAFMIIVGGLTRLTDSGLSITKWELFSGTLPPLNDVKWLDYFEEYKKIPEYKMQNYLMTMSEFKVIFWWEWAHRFFGRLIGLGFLIPLIYFSFKIKLTKLLNLYLIFFLICFQGFIGWYMVSSGLVNRLDVSHFRLSIHLLIAFLILSLILWNYLKLNFDTKEQSQLNIFFPIVFLFLVFLQIIIGAFVSGMDAGLIYNSWPMMGNTYFPDDNKLENLFDLAAFSDASLVQFLHRNLAYVILFYYFWILFKIYKYRIKNCYFAINLVGFFLFTQVILGIFTLISGAQIILASMHQLSSVFLVSASVYFLYLNRRINSFL